MKAIYIHGFQSHPTKEKVEILYKYFDEVFAPEIDWENEDERVGMFRSLSAIIRKQKITHVIGSSMGGQMAFYLATNLGLRGLCFNPAFEHLYFDFNFTKNKEFDGKVNIILGENDDIILPSKTISFLESEGYKKDSIEIESLNIDHIVDLKSFEYGVKKMF
jgi:predicted esterase YcpF (UPF0227 family)